MQLLDWISCDGREHALIVLVVLGRLEAMARKGGSDEESGRS